MLQVCCASARSGTTSPRSPAMSERYKYNLGIQFYTKKEQDAEFEGYLSIEGFRRSLSIHAVVIQCLRNYTL